MMNRKNKGWIDVEDGESGRLKIQFAYDRKLVDLVKTLPGRRYDRDTKAWFVPQKHLEQVLGSLMQHDFGLSPELEEVIELHQIDLQDARREVLLSRKPFLQEDMLPAGTWTIARLNHEVKELIRQAFREEVWMAAEIQGFDRNRRSGNAFFELVHRPYTGADPNARIAAVIWKDERERIERALHDDGGNVRLRDGLIVRFLCKVDFYTGQGRYQVTVSDIDLAYTSGTIHQNREAVLRALALQGIVEQNRDIDWVAVPLRVGLITSDGSDAHADFTHELERSGYGFDVLFAPANVQGAHTEESVLGALGYFARHADLVDIVVIVRGGGSRSDLAYFDTEAIGRAICMHPVKVMVGVGHQRDVCLLDYIAHSEKTPTAAAQCLVERVRQFVDRERELSERMFSVVSGVLAQRQGDIRVVYEHTLRLVDRAVVKPRRRVERLAFEFSKQVQGKLQQRTSVLDRLEQEVTTGVTHRLERRHARLDYAQKTLSLERMGRQLERKTQRLLRAQEAVEYAAQRTLGARHLDLDYKERSLRLLDPRRVLERGFALVTQQDGRVVRRAAHVSESQRVRVAFGQGHALMDVVESSETVSTITGKEGRQRRRTDGHEEEE